MLVVGVTVIGIVVLVILWLASHALTRLVEECMLWSCRRSWGTPGQGMPQ